MKKIFNFLKIIKPLYKLFFVAGSTCDSFGVIELGDYGDKYGAYSLVFLDKGVFPEHIHSDSDARFFFVSGKGMVTFNGVRENIKFKAGDVVDAPKGLPHGFLVEEAGFFIPWQSKPITDHKTGKRDVHYVDPNCELVD